MNYFQNLLESYSKLKKRQLRITLQEAEQEQAQDPQAIAIANSAIKSGLQYTSPDAHPGQTVGDRSLQFWVTQSGKNKGNVFVGAGLLGNRVQVIGDSGGNPIEGEAYTALINLASGNDPESGGKSKTPPELMPIPSPLADTGYSTPTGEIHINAYQENAIAAAKKGEFGSSPESYAKGYAPQSLERKLSETKGLVLTSEGPAERAVDADLIAGAAASARFISDLAISKKKDGDCDKVNERVMRSGNKIVYLHANDSQKGIAITPSPMDKFFMSEVEKKCGKPIQSVPRGAFTSKEKNEFLGKSIENLASIGPLIEMTSKLEAGEAKNKLQVWQKSKLGEVFSKGIQLAQASYAWALAQADSSLDLDAHLKEQFILEAGEIFSNPTVLQNILQQVNKLGKPIRNKYKPDMVVPTGQDKGYGNKGDVTYVFIGADAGKRAAKVNGALPEVITIGELQRRTNSDFTEIIPEYLKGLGLDPTTMSAETEVHVANVSMKTYMNFNSVKYGESESTANQRALLDGYDVDPAFRQQCISEVGIPVGKEAGVMRYRKEVMKVDTLVRDLIPDGNKFVTDLNGKSTPIDSQQAVGLIHAKLKKELNYGDQQISEFLKIITDDTGEPLDLREDTARSRVSEQISRLLTSARLNKDMNSADPTVRYNSRASEMFMMFGLGGEKGDGLADIRDVGMGQSYSISHNAPLRRCIAGVMDGSWEVQANNYGSSYFNPETGERITVGRERGKQSGKSVTRTVVNVNKACILADNQLTKKQSGLEDAIESYLDGQKTFLTELLKLAHTNQ